MNAPRLLVNIRAVHQLEDADGEVVHKLNRDNERPSKLQLGADTGEEKQQPTEKKLEVCAHA